jgi:SAM-dependent methyltransferase
MRHLLETLRLQPGETVASLGVGGGVWEVGLGALVPGLTVYLVELSPDLLNDAELATAVSFWEKQVGRPLESRFVPVIGTETGTNLPIGFFDKLLLLNSFHEFSQPGAMLAECRRILKPGGLVFVEEQLARSPGEVHEGCGRRLFGEGELVAFFAENGFDLCGAFSQDGSEFWKVLEFFIPRSETASAPASLPSISVAETVSRRARIRRTGP